MLSFLGCQLGRIGQAGAWPLEQTRCWEEAGLRAPQLQGLGPPPSLRAASLWVVAPSVSPLSA